MTEDHIDQLKYFQCQLNKSSSSVFVRFHVVAQSNSLLCMALEILQ